MKGDYSFIYDFKTKDKGGKVGNGSIRKGVPKESLTHSEMLSQQVAARTGTMFSTKMMLRVGS